MVELAPDDTTIGTGGREELGVVGRCGLSRSQREALLPKGVERGDEEVSRGGSRGKTRSGSRLLEFPVKGRVETTSVSRRVRSRSGWKAENSHPAEWEKARSGCPRLRIRD